MQVETNRLIIRDFEMEDWKAVHQYASDPKVTKYTIWGPNSEEETKAYIEHNIMVSKEKNRRDHKLAIVLKETGHLIGGCGIYVERVNAELGYCLHPEFWKRGYATEAAQAMLKIGFESFSVHRIYATCRPANIASARVMKRIGMKQEGYLREHVWHRGEYHDSYLFSILEHEFQERVRQEYEERTARFFFKPTNSISF